MRCSPVWRVCSGAVSHGRGRPVNKKIATALCGGAALVLVLSGCADNQELDAWAKTVCDSVQPQAKKISAANTAIQQVTSDNRKPAEVRQTDSRAFQDISDAYRAIGSAVEKAGPPPVDDGSTKQQDAVKELNSTSKAYADLKKQADDLNTKDQSKFADGLDDIATRLGTLVKSGDHALKKLQEGDVGKAMRKQESCKSASAGQPTD